MKIVNTLARIRIKITLLLAKIILQDNISDDSSSFKEKTAKVSARQ